MEIEAFIKNCEKQGILLKAQDDKLIYIADKGTMTEEIMMILKSRKKEILNTINNSIDSNIQFRMIHSNNNREILYDQIVWEDYAARKMENSIANMTNIVIRNSGEISSEILNKTIDILLERHKVLNSVIQMSGNKLYLVDQPKQYPELKEIKVDCNTQEDCEQNALRIAKNLVWEKKYDLDLGPLYHVFLIRIIDNEYILGAGLHHAIADGMSIGIFFQELAFIYASIVTKNNIEKIPPKYSYLDYLATMDNWLQSQRGKQKINFWVNQLKNTPETYMVSNEWLPVQRPDTGPAAEKIFRFDYSVTNEIKKLATNLKTTIFRLLFAVHIVTNWRMTAQKESVVIIMQSGRICNELHTMIGNFASEIAIKTSIEENSSFKEVTERIKNTFIDAESHQPVPLDLVRRILKKNGINFAAPIINYIPNIKEKENPETKQRIIKISIQKKLNDFKNTYGIQLMEKYREIEGVLIYRTDLYEESMALDFISKFQDTVEKIISDPIKKLYELEVKN